MLPMSLLLALALFSPLGAADAWEVLAFRNTPPNRVEFGDGRMTIAVDRSAGPVVLPLDGPTRVDHVRVEGRVTGTVQTTADRQGAEGADDFALRVGLVEAGARRPGFFERRFAPGWVRRLFALAPPDGGIGRIRFSNLGLDRSQIGWARTHPLSDLLVEEVVAAPDADGRFSFTAHPGDVPILAVWLSADGDDTGSTFTVRIDRLELVTS